MFLIQRALSRELLTTVAVCALIFVLLVLAVRSLGFIGQVAVGVLPASHVPLLLILKLATYLNSLLLLVMYITVLLTLERWGRDNELIAVTASGKGLTSLLPAFAPLFIVVTILTLAFSLSLSPWAVRKIDALNAERYARLTVEDIMPGVFARASDGRGVYFIESRDEHSGAFRKVFVYRSEDDASPAGKIKEEVVTAARAMLQGDANKKRRLVLYDGVRYEGDGRERYRVARFNQYNVGLAPRKPSTSPAHKLSWQSMHIKKLYIARNENNHAKAEWHWRLNYVLMLPVLLLFAIVFGSAPRGRATSTLSMFLVYCGAFLVYIAHINLSTYTIGLVRDGAAFASLAIYASHGAWFAAGLYLFQRRGRHAPLCPRPRLWQRASSSHGAPPAR